MAKRYRYRKPKMSTMSSVPAIYGLHSYVDMMNTLVRDVPKRIDRGRMLFLLSMSDFVRRAVERRAPDIRLGQKTVSYAEHLRIGIVDGAPSDHDSVVIYFDNQTLLLDADNMDGKALYFQATQESPKWVNVLMIYGPWPAHLVPVASSKIKARVISRNAREDELKALSDRIYAHRGEIESALRRAGAGDVSIEKTPSAVGVVVHEDVGYNILRTEFGYDGESQVAHWRPALREIKDAMPDLMRRYLIYLQTGRESAFDLPNNVANVTATQLNKSDAFARTLAPFAPRG